jgi:hypothetical protein
MPYIKLFNKYYLNFLFFHNIMSDKQKFLLAIVLVLLVILIGVAYYYYVYVVPSLAKALPATAVQSTTTQSAIPTYVGCYKDNSARVMPSTIGVSSWDACRQKAAASGAAYFGMQYAEGSPAGSGLAQCYYGNDYAKLGAATNCKAKDAQGRILGAYWSNAVYKL